MGLFRRRKTAQSSRSKAVSAVQAVQELAALIGGTPDAEAALVFRRSGRRFTLLPQSELALVLSADVSSAICLSVRDAGLYGASMVRKAQVAGRPIYWNEDERFSPRVWLENSAHLRALEAVTVHPGEYLCIYRNGIMLSLRAVGGQALLERVQALENLARLLPPDIVEGRAFKRAAVPAPLRPLRATALKWGLSDDSEREEALARATRAQLTRLVAKVDPLLPAIDALLDTDDSSEEACMLGDLAQAVLEAKDILQTST
jgi:hypothetical protein